MKKKKSAACILAAALVLPMTGCAASDAVCNWAEGSFCGVVGTGIDINGDGQCAPPVIYKKDTESFFGTFNGVDFGDGMPQEDFDPDGLASDDGHEGSYIGNDMSYLTNKNNIVVDYEIGAESGLNASWRGCTFGDTKESVDKSYNKWRRTNEDGTLCVYNSSGTRIICFVFDEDEKLIQVWTGMLLLPYEDGAFAD